MNESERIELIVKALYSAIGACTDIGCTRQEILKVFNSQVIEKTLDNIVS